MKLSIQNCLPYYHGQYIVITLLSYKLSLIIDLANLYNFILTNSFLLSLHCQTIKSYYFHLTNCHSLLIDINPRWSKTPIYLSKVSQISFSFSNNDSKFERVAQTNELFCTLSTIRFIQENSRFWNNSYRLLARETVSRDKTFKTDNKAILCHSLCE